MSDSLRAPARRAAIEPAQKDPADYDLVVLGRPVWAWTLSSPMRAYLTQNASQLDRVAFFCTEGGKGGDRAFREMSDLTGKQPVATLEVTETDLKTGADEDKLKPFASAIAELSDADRSKAAETEDASTRPGATSPAAS